jgi:hypothetical protein
MRQRIIDSTISALSSISTNRYFRSERGYQGAFYCKLRDEFEKYDLANEEQIIEMEYQKSSRHGMSQRPDIIFHIPVEHSGSNIDENNYAVWALKANANHKAAGDDFDKLEEMFRHLKYHLGFFININSDQNHLATYTGSFKDRIFAFAVWLQDDTIRLKQAYFEGAKFREKQLL